ncbi:FxLYD domain-containing protein [Altericista sp. CCNU0014]|uniref:FxLYD domain-containing protein n=1 Tax=Altericista sp. CCNU0014 TaxID=3082949 RepID=UPI00384B52CD
MASTGLPLVSRAQSPGDIIRIGTPGQWSQYESYWNQLINLGAASKTKSEASGTDATATATDPQVLEKQIARKLRVSNLQLSPILGLPGSSQLMGKITNNNAKAVTVSGVNVDILKSNGELAQTASARPQPATIPPGGTVTFSEQLLTVPADSGFQARLSRSTPFTIEGGI